MEFFSYFSVPDHNPLKKIRLFDVGNQKISDNKYKEVNHFRLGLIDARKMMMILMIFPRWKNLIGINAIKTIWPIKNSAVSVLNTQFS